jgi:hypothetical protein
MDLDKRHMETISPLLQVTPLQEHFAASNEEVNPDGAHVPIILVDVMESSREVSSGAVEGTCEGGKGGFEQAPVSVNTIRINLKKSASL